MAQSTKQKGTRQTLSFSCTRPVHKSNKKLPFTSLGGSESRHKLLPWAQLGAVPRSTNSWSLWYQASTKEVNRYQARTQTSLRCQARTLQGFTHQVPGAHLKRINQGTRRVPQRAKVPGEHLFDSVKVINDGGLTGISGSIATDNHAAACRSAGKSSGTSRRCSTNSPSAARCIHL